MVRWEVRSKFLQAGKAPGEKANGHERKLLLSLGYMADLAFIPTFKAGSNLFTSRRQRMGENEGSFHLLALPNKSKNPQTPANCSQQATHCSGGRVKLAKAKAHCIGPVQKGQKYPSRWSQHQHSSRDLYGCLHIDTHQ